MTEGHTGGTAGRVCATSVFTLALVLFLAVKFDFYYDLNDDTMIKDILSGAYTGTPDGHCIQMLYPLSWLLALFYKAIPDIPWYGLFLCLCQFFVLAAVAWRLTGLARRVWTKLFALVLEAVFVLGLFLRELVIIQYSVTAGICMAGAVFLFLTAPRVEKPALFFRKNLIPLALVILAFCIRTEICVMLLPFLLLAGIAKWGGEKKVFTGKNFRKYLMLAGVALLGMIAVYCVDMLVYRTSDWSSFRSFFDARTKLYDFYDLPDYDGNEEFYESIGLSRESFALLENYNFALDSSIDTWRLEAIAEYQAGRLHNTFGFVSKNSVGEALWLYQNQFREDFRAIAGLMSGRRDARFSASGILRLCAAAAYLLYIVWCVLCTKGRRRAATVWEILLLMVIRSVLWLYLYMVDRVLDRVTVPLLMTELVTIISLVLCGRQDVEETCGGSAAGTVAKVTTCVIYALCILCGLAAFQKNLGSVQEEYDGRAKADARWGALADYCRENGQNYYVIDVYSSTSYNGISYSEKLFADADNSYKNFDICGGWAAKSPLARQKLDRMGLKDVQDALYSTKAYFVAAQGKDLLWLAEYYRKRGMDVEPVCVDKISVDDGETAFEVYVLE